MNFKIFEFFNQENKLLFEEEKIEKKLKKIFYAIWFLIVLVSLFIFKDYGISWDEESHNRMAKAYLDYYFSFREDKSFLDDNKYYFNLKYYSNLSITISQLFAKITNYILGDYETNHLFGGIYGALLYLVTGLFAAYIGGWGSGILALIFFVLTPRIFGHSFFNLKDIPFALGYIGSIYYSIKCVDSFPKPKFYDIVKLILFIVIILSMKINGVLVYIYLAMFLFVKYISEIKNIKTIFNFSLIKTMFLFFIIIVVFSFVISILLWPYALVNPVDNIVNVFKNFSNFTNLQAYFQFEGDLYNALLNPWYFVPKWIIISIPLFVIIGLILSLIVTIKLFINKNYKLVYYLKVLYFVSLFPIGYIIYSKAVAYSDWRHVFFVYPSMVIIAAVSWKYLITYFNNNKKVKYIIYAIIFVLCFRVLYWSVKNHPNQYIYFNELIGGTKGAYGKYTFDYWGNSQKQAIDWMGKNLPIPTSEVKIGSNVCGGVSQYFADKYSKNYKVVWLRAGTRYVTNWDYAILTDYYYHPNELSIGSFPPKGTIHTINVDGMPILAIVKRIDENIQLGYQNESNQKYEEAYNNFKKAYFNEPRNIEITAKYGDFFLRANILDSAERIYDEALSYNPSYVYAIYRKATIYQERNMWNEKVKFYQKKENYIDNCYVCKDDYVESLLKIGDSKSAILVIERMFDLNQFTNGEDHLKYLALIAEECLKIKDYNKALKYYEKAYVIYPVENLKNIIDQLKEYIKKH